VYIFLVTGNWSKSNNSLESSLVTLEMVQYYQVELLHHGCMPLPTSQVAVTGVEALRHKVP